ncbi:hypothetical protein [Spiroplasma endosymbiont of Polydrusus pterygomalis]|uniref:hypothetical protein n=1 Tax=Spiroplasma endosymbiont of Polydrusus pterygomalis TaxID=3139327 RepID=UPI003CCAB8FB
MNSFKTINFVEEVNINVNMIEKQKIKEKWITKIDKELREQNRNGKNGYILWEKKNKKSPFDDIKIKTSSFCF